MITLDLKPRPCYYCGEDVSGEQVPPEEWCGGWKVAWASGLNSYVHSRCIVVEMEITPTMTGPAPCPR